MSEFNYKTMAECLYNTNGFKMHKFIIHASIQNVFSWLPDLICDDPEFNDGQCLTIDGLAEMICACEELNEDPKLVQKELYTHYVHDLTKINKLFPNPEYDKFMQFAARYQAHLEEK